MSTATAYPATMAEMKTDPAHSSMWPNYGGHVPMTARFGGGLDPGLSSYSSSHQGRPRSSNPPVEQPPYHYGRYSQDESDAYEKQQQQHPAGLHAHHSYPNLKRPYAQAEQPPYTEIVQDLRDDGSKLTVNHDHKLLSFRKVQDKHTIVDQRGQMQQLELSAQLHGMFFLSEMPSNATDGAALQPELTCYRRNLFQISGSLITPRGQLSVVTETGETVPVNSTEVTISAIESVDGHPVRLIVIPWKTPPPNSPEISQSPDQEPPSLPLIPFQDDGSEADGEWAVYPIGWRRLQFRIATANNGRRKELQQHFVLHLKVIGTLANNSKVVLTESTTAPIVVRGRSPRNFQARKEIPLLGSSAGSRGQALVETGLGIVAGPLTVKPPDAKARALNMELPRSAFTFNAPKLPGSPIAMRSNSYPTTWPGTQPPMSHIPSSGAAHYPATTVAADHYQKMPISGSNNFTAEPQEMPMQTSMPSVQLSLVANDHHQQQQPPIRTQYAYVQATSAPSALSISTTADTNLNVPRYVENNPRPSKSPRHASHQSVHSSSSITNNDSSPEYRYGPPYVPVNSNSNEISSGSTHPPAGYAAQDSNSAPTSATSNPPPPRDYFPSSNSWTTTAGEPTSSTYSNNEGRAYAYNDQYKPGAGLNNPPKSDQNPAQSGSGVYGGSRGTFDAMNHYSWNAT